MLLLVVFLAGCAIALMGHASICFLAAKINRQRDPGGQISYLLSGPWVIIKEYRQLYTSSRLHLLPLLFLVMGFFWFLSLVWLLFARE